MRLRPHHVIDIVTSFGHGQEFGPHPYGHSLHTVAEAVLADADVEVEFVVKADDICRPGRSLCAFRWRQRFESSAGSFGTRPGLAKPELS